MSVISQILITVVAVEFFYILYLETFVPSSKTTGRVFKMSQEELDNATVQTLFKNQGIYNGLIATGLLYGAYFATAQKEISLLLLIYILLVATYGSFTSDKMIFLKQGGVALTAFLSIVF